MNDIRKNWTANKYPTGAMRDWSIGCIEKAK